MKYLLTVLMFFFVLISYTQPTLDLLPKTANRVGISLAGSSFLHISCEYKLGAKTTIVPKIGVGFVYQAGTNPITYNRFSEFGLYPVLDADLRYYFSLTNKNRKGEFNKVFSGTYISALPWITQPLIGSYQFIEWQPSYGLIITCGKQIEKLSNWNFNYYIGYALISKFINDGTNTSNNNFRLGLTVGYSL